MNARRLVVGFLVAVASTAAAKGGDAPAERVPLSKVRAQVSKAYEQSRASLAVLGKKASEAAAGADFEAWKAANAAYVEGAVDLQLACENAVRDLSTKPSDVGDVGFKQVFDALAPYLKAAGPLLEARLRLQAYTELLLRTDPDERRAALDALTSIYFTGK